MALLSGAEQKTPGTERNSSSSIIPSRSFGKQLEGPVLTSQKCQWLVPPCSHCRMGHRWAQFWVVAYCERLKVLSSPTERLWDLCETPAGSLCLWDDVLRPNTFFLSLQKIHEAFQHRGRKGGKRREWEEENSFWPRDNLEMLPEEINFLLSLTVTPGYAARLNFWILLTSPMFICEIGNAVLPCIQVLKVTAGLLVNLRMWPQIKISSFIRGFWQIHRVWRRGVRESGKLDFLRESR